MADTSAHEPIPPEAVFSPGRHIADYKILRRVGRGGMADVYLCRDQKLGRKVALKVLVNAKSGRALEKLS